MNLVVQPLLPSDYPSVHAIYLDGIATGHATFEQSAPVWDKWDADHLANCRFVARQGNDIAGWAALSAVSSRCVYAGVAEVSVYVASAARGQGVGRVLLNHLIAASEAQGIWTLQAGIFPENIASIRLHESAGFRIVGRRERIGQMNGIWRDTVLMERRSSKIG